MLFEFFLLLPLIEFSSSLIFLICNFFRKINLNNIFLDPHRVGVCVSVAMSALQFPILRSCLLFGPRMMQNIFFAFSISFFLFVCFSWLVCNYSVCCVIKCVAVFILLLTSIDFPFFAIILYRFLLFFLFISINI